MIELIENIAANDGVYSGDHTTPTKLQRYTLQQSSELRPTIGSVRKRRARSPRDRPTTTFTRESGT